MEDTGKLQEQILADFITKPFELKYDNTMYGFTRLSHDLDLTLLYTHKDGAIWAPLPRALVFHPYHPNGTSEANEADYAGTPGSVVTVRLPKDALAHLPSKIIMALKSSGVDSANVDIFFTTQNMPWKNETLLLRMNHWAHGQPDSNQSMAEHKKSFDNVTYNRDTPCRVGIFSATTPEMKCDNLSDQLSPNPISVSSHPGTDDKFGIPMIIASPNGVGVMSNVDFNRTDSLYSVAVRADKQRAAVTLNWLLSPEDEQLLEKISREAGNLERLIRLVAGEDKSRLNLKEGPLDHLLALLNAPKLAASVGHDISGLQKQEAAKSLLFSFNKTANTPVNLQPISEAMKKNDVRTLVNFIKNNTYATEDFLWVAIEERLEGIIPRLFSGELIDNKYLNGNKPINGETPLDHAIKKGLWSAVKVLLSYNLKDRLTTTTEDFLFLAIENNAANIVRRLISGELIASQYMDVNLTRESDGKKPLDVAMETASPDIQQQLRNCGAKRTDTSKKL